MSDFIVTGSAIGLADHYLGSIDLSLSNSATTMAARSKNNKRKCHACPIS